MNFAQRSLVYAGTALLTLGLTLPVAAATAVRGTLSSPADLPALTTH